MSFYKQSTAQLFEHLESGQSGLTESEVQKRLIKFGPNALQEKKKKPAWLLFLGQFKDFMILILAAAAVISGIVGDLTDTIIILVIILLNVWVGFGYNLSAPREVAIHQKDKENLS
ncbi:MAG: hypothetical protein B7Z16_09410, partial [Algoriphagus sp. 32-45-6]